MPNLSRERTIDVDVCIEDNSYANGFSIVLAIPRTQMSRQAGIHAGIHAGMHAGIHAGR